jgi:hypothetical protein
MVKPANLMIDDRSAIPDGINRTIRPVVAIPRIVPTVGPGRIVPLRIDLEIGVHYRSRSPEFGPIRMTDAESPANAWL